MVGLVSLVSLLRRGIVDQADAEELIRLYGALFDMHGIVVSSEFGFGPFAAHTEIEPEWVAEHRRHQDQDPSPNFLAAAPEGEPFVMASAFERLRRTEIFQALRRHRMSDGIVQSFTTPWQQPIFLAMYRRDGQRSVDDADRALAFVLYPHMAGALATRSAQASLAKRDALGHSQAHAFVSYPSAKVELSARARKLFSTHLGPIGRIGWRRITAMIARHANAFSRGDLAARSRMILPTLRCELAAVPAKRGETHRVLALFFREPEQERPLDDAIAELLSPKQRQVARLAARGATNAQIAQHLSMSVATVRTHLRAIFERLGVSRRSELAHRLSTS